MATWHLAVHLLKVLQNSGDEYYRVCGDLLFTVGIFSIFSKKIIASVD
jgi:hypothetical protein